MADLSKVLKGFERCMMESDGIQDNPCADCPYLSKPGCSTALKQDAVDLLKAQREEIKRLAKPAGGTWIQKADAMGHEYSMCSACETVINTPDGCGGYYKLDMTGAKYCPNCGAKMD